MKELSMKANGILLCGLIAAALAVGCGVDVKKHGHGEHRAGHDHSGWWCDEHGIPEEECSLCSKKVETECKEKGDWCQEHERAKSQCFKCDPSLKEKYAKKYRDKYGKEPPPITED
jgi:hypothetical protein